MAQNIDPFLLTVMCPRCAREVHKDNYCSFCGSALQNSHGLYDAPSVGLEFADSFLDEEKVLVRKNFTMLLSDSNDEITTATVTVAIEGERFEIVTKETRKLLKRQKTEVVKSVRVIVGVIMTIYGCTLGHREYEEFGKVKRP